MKVLTNTLKRVFGLLLPQSFYHARRMREHERTLLDPKHCTVSGNDVSENWQKCIQDVLAAEDNKFIRRVAGAGCLEGPFLIMHNGVRVCGLGYYGSGMLKMLQDNRGVHEPQEERVFQNIISYLPKKCTMIELGAYWAFYSLSLLQERPSAKCYLIEPDARNLMSGRINFRCNQRRGVFVQAFVGAQECSEPRTIAVDSFMAQRRIKHVNILHADIQGAEYEMLLGAEKSLQLRLIDFIFISTHSASLHEACRQRLGDYGYIILADINLSETHSYDGLLVAKAPIIPEPIEVNFTKKALDEE